MNNQQSTGGGEWRPIKATCKETGRSVHITIFERELYKSGFFSFEDLYQIYEAVDNPDYDKNTDGDGCSDTSQISI